MFKSKGKLIYSPSSHVGTSEKWLVLMCDDEISKYYRKLYTYSHKFANGGYSLSLTRPIWGAHISLIRGEKLPNNHLWRLDENKIIEFEYEAGVQSNNEYYWLRVKCDYLLDLREKYGLKRNPQFGLHLTVGRTTL